MSNFKKKYLEEIVPAFKKAKGYTSSMQVPKLLKISINQGVGRAIQDKRMLERSIEEITLIAGQRAVPTRAKKSVSNFKLREGMSIGTKVTLRGHAMYDFLERLILVALPRVRDFKGIQEKGFDRWGNYTLGIQEQIIFPEVSIDKVHTIMGMNITFVTNAKNKEESYLLLRAFGFPFTNMHKKQL